MRSLTSSANPQFKIWRSLTSSKGIKSEGLFLLSGEKLIREFLKDPSHEIVAEIVRPQGSALQASAPAYDLSRELFEELDVIGTHFNLLVLKSRPLPTSSSEDESSALELIAPIGDPGNLGALIRSAVAFGVSKIHLTQESAHPFHPKCVKASAGAVLRAPLYQSGPVSSWDHPSVWALALEGPSIVNTPTPQRVRVLVGEEGPGLPELRVATKVSIPNRGVESLNATVAASLALWHLSKKSY
ncbi:MAG: TrmH family RNA methyltransferase [Bdellovibrionales bacterium]